MYLLSTLFKQGFLVDVLIYNICTIQQKLICFLTMFIWLKTFVTIYETVKILYIFPPFSFSLNDQLLASSENGYITWRDFQDLYEEDTKRKAFLQMSPKIAASPLHPGNNKQQVALALAIFHKTTIAAFKIYKPAWKDTVGFLTFSSSWWAMINSKQRYNPNALGNALENERFR